MTRTIAALAPICPAPHPAASPSPTPKSLMSIPTLTATRMVRVTTKDRRPGDLLATHFSPTTATPTLQMTPPRDLLLVGLRFTQLESLSFWVRACLLV